MCQFGTIERGDDTKVFLRNEPKTKITYVYLIKLFAYIFRVAKWLKTNPIKAKTKPKKPFSGLDVLFLPNSGLAGTGMKPKELPGKHNMLILKN